MTTNSRFLQLRLKIADLMLQILRLQTANANKPNKRLVLYEMARACIGKDMALIQNELGCAEAVNGVFEKAFGTPVGGGASTYQMYGVLRKDKRFQRVFSPLAGDIIISPTGYGNGSIKNGHVGIMDEKENIMSNNSLDGLWKVTHTLSSWQEKYGAWGGFPIEFYRVI